jgi:hypothetical protein
MNLLTYPHNYSEWLNARDVLSWASQQYPGTAHLRASARCALAASYTRPHIARYHLPRYSYGCEVLRQWSTGQRDYLGLAGDRHTAAAIALNDLELSLPLKPLNRVLRA